MAQYHNLKVVTYIPAAITARGTKEQIESDLAFLESMSGSTRSTWKRTAAIRGFPEIR